MSQPMSQPEQQLTFVHRALAAGGASLVSAVIVNPLDVVKTRIQAQGATGTRTTPQPATLLEKWNFAGCGPTCVRIENPALPTTACGPGCAPTSTPIYSSTWQGLRTIARTEGLRSLWRGTDVALMMSIPMVGIYLPLYDYCLAELQKEYKAGVYAPLVAGTVARTAAVYCTAPFELIRTRMQAVRAPAAALTPVVSRGGSIASAGSVLLSHIPRETSRLRTFKKLWTGVGATLARDVPFSALYWAMVEPIRTQLLLPQGAESELQVVAANVTAGGISGALAGAITTPLDVVKTRTQLSAVTPSPPMLSTLRSIAASEGMSGLFIGWTARSAKAAPACAMVLSAYEMLKFMYTE